VLRTTIKLVNSMDPSVINQSLLRDFTQLGNTSFDQNSECTFNPREVCIFDFNVEDFSENNEPEITAQITNKRMLQPIPLSPQASETTVVGIDTSSIEIGETTGGVICAIRGCIVSRENNRYSYERYGPFLFHVTEQNKHGLYNILRRQHFGIRSKVYAPNLWCMPGRIRNVLERLLQKHVCQHYRDSLILFDGSLTAHPIDSPVPIIRDLLEEAERRRSVILAFSKRTRLYVSGCRIIDLIDDQYAPCILDIDDTILPQYRQKLCFLGRVHVAKLAPGCFSFRLDIDRNIPEEERIEAVQKLIGNDIVLENYPETLRLAHILSKFTANEVIAMQRFIAENYGLRIHSRPDVRQVLFGPFSGSNVKRGGETYDAFV